MAVNEKEEVLPSVKFIYQIIFNVCIDFHILIKYLLKVYSMSWTVLNAGYTVYNKKDKVLILTEPLKPKITLFSRVTQ